jgi:hypothetical protein
VWLQINHHVDATPTPAPHPDGASIAVFLFKLMAFLCGDRPPAGTGERRSIFDRGQDLFNPSAQVLVLCGDLDPSPRTQYCALLVSDDANGIIVRVTRK